MTERASPAEYLRAFDTLDTLVGMVEAATLNRARSRARAATVPVVIVAGFLGAGKTTLLRHLLTANHGLKIAAMVNDVAALNIDAALIGEVNDDTTALTNGCVCCSLSGGVARGLAQIAARPDPADAVVIEASGVSDPAGIAQVAATVDGVRLDSIVTVVDAEASLRPTDWDHLLARQVAPATLIVLNKTDLVPRDSVDHIAERLAAMAPKAQVLRTVRCAVPASVIIDAPMDPVTEAHFHPAMHDFAARVLVAPSRLHRADMEAALAQIPNGILRIKGFLCLDGEPVLLQGVGRRWTLERAASPLSAPGLVVIGVGAPQVEAFWQTHLAGLGFRMSHSAR